MKTLFKRIKTKIKKYIELKKWEKEHRYCTLEDGYWRFPENQIYPSPDIEFNDFNDTVLVLQFLCSVKILTTKDVSIL